MLNSAKRQIDKNCLRENLNARRFLRARKARRIVPAKSILEPVKKSGGECSRAIFPNENILDQPAYIKITRRIDMLASISRGLSSNQGLNCSVKNLIDFESDRMIGVAQVVLILGQLKSHFLNGSYHFQRFFGQLPL